MTAIAQPTPSTQRLPRGAAVTALTWFALAIIAGATGWFGRLVFPVGQLIILGLTAGVIIATLAPTSFRDWLDSVSLRWLVGINISRFVGIAFLALAAQGRLNPVFAFRAGWGDIIVASTAILLITVRPPRLVMHAWNLFGAFDLLTAVGTATMVLLQGLQPDVRAILTFPLSLIPTFAIPVLLANHVLIFRRLNRDAS
ncbi:MAG TPA: hypothetical protein VH439_16185 [Gemmatimonadales bacterium]|jgi:hypothetical protein